MSADGVIFNNVYDNGYSNNQVIFSLRDDLKNGRVFKKGAKPLEKSQFIDTGTSMNGDLDINKNIQNFVEYLTIPSEFNSQLHPLIEFEQRAGKSGVPNFKSVDEIDRLINNNPYVGTSENNGLRNLRLLFNYIIKDKNEFMRRFNKYGFGVVPATTVINNYDNE